MTSRYLLVEEYGRLPVARASELRPSPGLAVVLYTLLSGSGSAWAQRSWADTATGRRTCELGPHTKVEREAEILPMHLAKPCATPRGHTYQEQE